MITSIYSGFASVNSISLRCCASLSLSLFLNFYLYINPLKKMLPYRRWANVREFYYCIIVASHANTHNSYTIWLSSYLFFCLSLAARLSLTPSHSHALQQLIRFINSHHRFIVRINYVSLCREVSRPSGCLLLPSRQQSLIFVCLYKS